MDDQARVLRNLADKVRESRPASSMPVQAVPPSVRSSSGAAAEDAGQAGHASLGALWPDAEQGGASGERISPARVIAVTSGKGGTGKSNFVANLAVTLGARGCSVVVVDLDLGLANLDIIFGKMPRHNLGHVINGTMELSDIMVDLDKGVKLIPGASGIRSLADLEPEKREELLRSLDGATAGADFVILDTGAGLSRSVTDFVAAADEAIIVTTSEPTAMTDAYAMVKVVSTVSPNLVLRIVVNMARSEEEAVEAADHLNLVAQRFLGTKIEFLGYIPFSHEIPRAVKERRPFVRAYPRSQAARCMDGIASSLLGGGARRTDGRLSGFMAKLARLVARPGA